MNKNIGLSKINIQPNQIPNLKDRIVFNEEKEITGIEMSDGPKSDVCIIYTKDPDSAELQKQIAWLEKILKWLKLNNNQWTQESYPPAPNKEQNETNFVWFKNRTLPRLKHNQPKIILTFGKEAAYPFFRNTDYMDKENWFTEIHSRFHLKNVKGVEEPWIIYCFPSLKLCADTKIANEIKFAFEQVRGYLLEKKVINVPNKVSED